MRTAILITLVLALLLALAGCGKSYSGGGSPGGATTKAGTTQKSTGSGGYG